MLVYCAAPDDSLLVSVLFLFCATAAALPVLLRRPAVKLAVSARKAAQASYVLRECLLLRTLHRPSEVPCSSWAKSEACASSGQGMFMGAVLQDLFLRELGSRSAPMASCLEASAFAAVHGAAQGSLLASLQNPVPCCGSALCPAMACTLSADDVTS